MRIHASLTATPGDEVHASKKHGRPTIPVVSDVSALTLRQVQGKGK